MNDSLAKESFHPGGGGGHSRPRVRFGVLIWMTTETYRNAPPIPDKVVTDSGETIFTADDILQGRRSFSGMASWKTGRSGGTGGYLGPDFSATYLHALALEAGEVLSKKNYDRRPQELKPPERAAVEAEVQQALKQNRYDPRTKTLSFTAFEAASYRNQTDA